MTKPFNIREDDPTYEEDLYFIEGMQVGERKQLIRQIKRAVLENGKSISETALWFGMTEDEVQRLIQENQS